MGMSASQARLLSLEARQSNLEYQGQQINQERTILSQQCTALYNSLLSMTVPTPPSTADYTYVQYTGSDGATNYSFDSSSVKPGSNGNYKVTLGTTEYGKCLKKNNGYATTTEGEEKVYGKFVTRSTYVENNTSTKNEFIGYKEGTKAPASGDYYMQKATGADFKDGDEVYIYNNYQFVATKYDSSTMAQSDSLYKKTNVGTYNSANGDKAIGEEIKQDVTTTQSSEKTIAKDALDKFYVYENGVVRNATENDFEAQGTTPESYKLRENTTYLWNNGTREDEASFKNNDKGTLISGKTAYTLADAVSQGIINQTDYDGYKAAIENAAIKAGTNAAGKQTYGVDDFYIYKDDDGALHFALKSDVDDKSGACVTYDFVANGEYTKNHDYDDCQLEFDPTSGRITSISYPTTYGADGKPTAYSTVDLKAETKTDENAYNDAYAQYEYETYLYDQKNKEINAKTEVIQQEDKNLELKLQRLDNERTQITTEIEAVKKVINDNIEGSYKTFSG